MENRPKSFTCNASESLGGITHYTVTITGTGTAPGMSQPETQTAVVTLTVN